MKNSSHKLAACGGALAILVFCFTSVAAGGFDQSPPGKTPGVERRMESLQPDATFKVGGDPDWMAVADDAVWVAISSLNRVTQLNAARNEVGVSIPVQEPCSGLVAGFGSLWIPSCGTHSLVRADLKTGSVQAAIPIGPADSEGCVAVGADSVWLATNRTGILSRIEPKTNAVVASITIPSGSFCPVFADGFVWVTSTEPSVLAKIDPETNKTGGGNFGWEKSAICHFGSGSSVDAESGRRNGFSRGYEDRETGRQYCGGIERHCGEIAFGFGLYG